MVSNPLGMASSPLGMISNPLGMVSNGLGMASNSFGAVSSHTDKKPLPLNHLINKKELWKLQFLVKNYL